MTEFRAFVERERGADGYRLHLLGPRGGRRADILRSDGSWESVEEGQMASGETGIFLPRDAWQAVMALVNPPADLKYLEDALAVERARVDAVLKELLPR